MYRLRRHIPSRGPCTREAIQKAAAFRSSGKHPYLLGKMALPIDDLKKIRSRLLVDSGADGSAWIFTALGSFKKADIAGDFARQVEWDMREIRRCNERGFESSCRQWICAYESLLPWEYRGIGRRLSGFMISSPRFSIDSAHLPTTSWLPILKFRLLWAGPKAPLPSLKHLCAGSMGIRKLSSCPGSRREPAGPPLHPRSSCLWRFGFRFLTGFVSRRRRVSTTR